MPKFYTATGLTGGGSALDGFDGANLEEGDWCLTVTSQYHFVHILRATSGKSASAPDVIIPLTNAGTKRWEVVPPGKSNISLDPNPVLGGNLTFNGSRAELDFLSLSNDEFCGLGFWALTGATFTASQCGYWDASTASMKLALGTAITTMPCIGMALEGITSGEYGFFMLLGIYKYGSAYASNRYWISVSSAGNLQTSSVRSFIAPGWQVECSRFSSFK